MNIRFDVVKSPIRQAAKAAKIMSPMDTSFRKHVQAADKARDAGDLVGAIAGYRSAISVREDQAGVWVQLGNMLKDIGNHEEAESAYRTALRLRPNHSDTYLQLGHLMKLAGRPNDAQANYETALSLDKDNPHAFVALADLQPSSKVLNEVSTSTFTMPERIEIQELLRTLKAKHAEGFALFQDPVFRAPARR
jgi:tetratricopeptide (TPR) repeat protein